MMFMSKKVKMMIDFDLQRFAYIYNSAINSLVIGTSEDDFIENRGSGVTIDTGEDDDSVYNRGGIDCTINTGEGNDSVKNEGDWGAINTGAGNDSIYNLSRDCTINTGAGNDSVKNEGNFCTINTGAGNDLVNLGVDAYRNVIIYDSDDGNDTIKGFKTNDTLQIGDGYGTYYKEIIGNDVVVTVGEGTITLVGAASLEAVNVSGILRNTLTGATLVGGAGNDDIDNYGSNVVVNGGEGDDHISNGGYYGKASNSTISGGAGNDDIENFESSNVKIYGGAGNDGISNNGGSDSFITGGADDDYISNSGKNATIDGAEGDDTITNEGGYPFFFWKNGSYVSEWREGGSHASINGGEGNDSIKNVLVREYINSEGYYKNFSPDNSTLEGGAGNDTIENDGSDIIIEGGLGDDYIINYHYHGSGEEGDYGGNNVLFKYTEGYGNDTIEGFNDTSTLQIGGGTGTCSVGIDGSDLIVQVGDGTIRLAYAAEKGYKPQIEATHSALITGTESADNIANVFDGVTVDALGGDDTVKNWGSNSEINAGDGNNQIDNHGDSSTINGGEGADSIDNASRGSSISGGAGDDVINNVAFDDGYESFFPDNSTIDGGDGNDTITNNGDSVTIAGGKGDDSIKNSGGENVLFKYAAGDGNDLIQGFRADSTLQIGDGTDTYLGVKSGNDIILTVGEGKITLSGAASLKSVNIEGTEVSTPVWTLSDTTATYGTWKNTLITINGVKSLDGISLKDKVVTVSNAALNQGTVTISDGYTLELGSDVTQTSTIAAGWNLNGSTATYKNTTTTAGYSLANNQISYVGASGGETLATVTGIKSLSGISLNGTTVTVSNAALNQGTVQSATATHLHWDPT